MNNEYYVYILTDENNAVLYTGVTSALTRRVAENRARPGAGFITANRVTKLVYYETFGELNPAIAREKQIKAVPRQKKLDLVKRMNPRWRDLYDDLGA